MLGNESIISFEMENKKPIGYFYNDPGAKEAAIHFGEKGHELSLFSNLENFENSPNSWAITILTSCPNMYRLLAATGHEAIYIHKDCCAERTLALISEECLGEDTSKATRFNHNL